MPTTGGALAFDGFVPPYEATLTKNLRDAGAIIIAKTGLTELANWVAGAPTPMPANYNALGGYGFNPYDPRRDPRAATFDGRPALCDRRIELGHRHGRELLGRQRRHRDVGLDPEPGEPEHAGGHQADRRPHQPLRRHSDHRRSGHARPDGAKRAPTRRSCSARSKAPRPIPNDAATQTCTPPPGRDYTTLPRTRARSRARASASRARSTTTRSTPPGAKEPRGGLNADQAKVMAEAIDVLKQQGAVDRRSRPTSRASSTGRAPTTSCSGASAAARTTPRARTPTARSCSSTA